MPCGELGDVPVRVFRPRAAPGSLPVVVWVHGGAYVVGSASQDDLLCSDLAVRTGSDVVSANRSAERPYPSGWPRAHAALFGLPASGYGAPILPAGGPCAGAGRLAAAVALCT